MTEPAVCPLPTVRSHPLSPPDGLAGIAADGVRKVTFPNGVDAWIFGRYEDFRMILSDRRFSARKDNDAPETRIGESIVGTQRPGAMNTRDGAEHLRLRRPLARAFVVKRIEALRPRIQELVDEHLDAMERQGSPADLMSALCQPVPSLVIAELLGVPYEHHDLFQRTAKAVFSLYNPASDYEALAEELGAVIVAEMEKKRAQGYTDDLLGVLANDTESNLELEELINMSIGILVAGHETTANFMGLFLLTMFEHPEQLEFLRGDPSRVDHVVEELMRYTMTVGAASLVRRATEDVQVGDTLVREGEWVCVSMLANFDESLCPHSSQLDVSRDAVPHVSFGFGPHQCLGQNLARAELQIMLRSLFTRFPTLQLAKPVSELAFHTDTITYGPAQVPVVW